MKSSWKTSATGIGAIFSAVYGTYIQVHQGVNPDWPTAIAAIAGGLGLIFARDNNVTSEQAGAGKTATTPARSEQMDRPDRT